MNKRTLLLLLFICLTVSSLYGQRRGASYQALLMQTDRPNTYFDHISFPVSDSTSQFAFLFRLDYDAVPFLKKNRNIKAPNPEAQYYAPLQIGLEIYEGKTSRRSSDLATSIYRDTWQDTLWVDSYEKTTSRTDYTQGIINTRLDAGQYHYEVQLPRSKVPVAGDPRSGTPIKERPAPKRNVEISGAAAVETADFILLRDFQNSNGTFSATFFNYGNNILYGQDYSLLIQIPNTANGNVESLSLKLYRLVGGANADSRELRHSVEISSDQVVRLGEVDFTSSEDNIGFEADISEDGTAYACVHIPNENFENARYRLILENSENGEVLGEKMIQSQWLDMPVSLYNLNVAIDMLRFIVSDSKLDEIDSGSDTERERKFREFWAQRDPTPDTEFNELMTEYYDRIDYAYNEFSSLQVPGFETDQGRTYILYGPPDEVERRMPTDAPTREIWHYPNKTLIFEATTGFGDFKLISEQQS